MTEPISATYKPLFEVHLLHHYWQHEDPTELDLIPGQVKKGTQLRKYDRRSFLPEIPAETTAQGLKNLNCVYKNTALFSYTALTLQSQKIQYFNKKTNTVASTELNPLPLTHCGKAGTKQKTPGRLGKSG